MAKKLQKIINPKYNQTFQVDQAILSNQSIKLPDTLNFILLQ
jgi:hypothetical protein